MTPASGCDGKTYGADTDCIPSNDSATIYDVPAKTREIKIVAKRNAIEIHFRLDMPNIMDRIVIQC
jgi:hypothetical protein